MFLDENVYQGWVQAKTSGEIDSTSDGAYSNWKKICQGSWTGKTNSKAVYLQILWLFDFLLNFGLFVNPIAI